MRAVLLIAALTVAVPDRPAPIMPEQAKPLTEQIKGEWQIVASMMGGQPHQTIKPGQTSFVFTADKMILRLRPETTGANYAIKLDTTNSPAGIDIALPNKAATASIVGIIKIEGDTLTICYRVGAGADRPTEFASPANSRIILWQMKRVK